MIHQKLMSKIITISNQRKLDETKEYFFTPKYYPETCFCYIDHFVFNQ